jgi:hypothetical protein
LSRGVMYLYTQRQAVACVWCWCIRHIIQKPRASKGETSLSAK